MGGSPHDDVVWFDVAGAFTLILAELLEQRLLVHREREE
jgi:hypothetical protein